MFTCSIMKNKYRSQVTGKILSFYKRQLVRFVAIPEHFRIVQFAAIPEHFRKFCPL